MTDRFGRVINYLRISVTDRCNLRCEYCMPPDGIRLIDKNEILSFEEIAEVVRVGAGRIGIKKIRLTGGEPLVRKGIVKLVEWISKIDGIEDISMTTNAVLLDSYAESLKKAGLMRVNISLDTLSPARFRSMTHGGEIKNVLKGLQAAKKAGLKPIKVNAVHSGTGDNKDIEQVKAFCAKEEFQFRQIEKMSLTRGQFTSVHGGTGGDCVTCNRIRLMSNGNMKPCLFSNQSFNIREYGIEKAFHLAINAKPEKGEYTDNHQFYNIGG